MDLFSGVSAVAAAAAASVGVPAGVPTSSGGAHVLLKDVGHLVRLNAVAVPSGFTKLGHPLLYFPNKDNDKAEAGLLSMSESDLHLLFKYYLAVVPRAEQAHGFALIIDRRLVDFSTHVRGTFQKIVSLFPAPIREVYLLHGPGSGLAKDMIVSQLIDEFLLDFDVFHLNNPGELMHHVDTKYIPSELGGQLVNDVEAWLLLQEHVETFSFSARRIARRLAQFVGVLNQVSSGLDQVLSLAFINDNHCHQRVLDLLVKCSQLLLLAL